MWQTRSSQDSLNSCKERFHLVYTCICNSVFTNGTHTLRSQYTFPQIIKETPSQLWNLKVHYHVTNSWPLVPLLCQMNPVHNLPECPFNIILSTMLRCPKWSYPREQEPFMNVPFLSCVLLVPNRNIYNAYLDFKMKSYSCGVRDQGFNIADTWGPPSLTQLFSRSPKWKSRKMQ
jgi:hypothetical protein